MTRGLLFAALVATGCYPFAGPVIAPIADTPEVLQRGKVELTAVGGGGGFAGWGGGGADVRVKVGVGAQQEIHVETAALAYAEILARGMAAASGRVAWKLGILPILAFEAGAGFTWATPGWSAGMDATLILGRSRGVVRPYFAPRLSLSLPVDRPISDMAGVTGTMLVPGGLAFVVHPRAKLFLEAGLTTIWASPSQGVSVGGYGLLGVAVRLTR